MCKFYRLTESSILELIENLSHVETIVFLLLKARNPFTNSYKTIKTKELAETLKVTQRTIQRSLKKLKELNLIEYNVTECEYKIFNLKSDVANNTATPVSSATRHQDRTDDTRIATTTPVSLETTPVSPPISETLTATEFQNALDYKTKKTPKTFLEDNEEKNKKNSINQNGSNASHLDNSINQSSLTTINQDLTTQPIIKKEDQFSPHVEIYKDKNNKPAIEQYSGQKRNQQSQQLPVTSYQLPQTADNCSLITHNCKQFGEWIPSGPWLKISESGRRYLDHAFVEYRAKKFFVKNWGDELPEAISKTIKYYRNDIERLAIDWEEYHHTALLTASSIQAYTRSTGEIKQADVQKLQSISSAFQSLPENLQSNDHKPLQSSVTSYELSQTADNCSLITDNCKRLSSENVNLPIENSKTINSTHKALPFAKNAEEYRKMNPIKNEATPEQKTEFFNALHQMFGTHHQGKSQKHALSVANVSKGKSVKSRLEILNQNLKDKILKPYVIQEVNNSGVYEFIYNEITHEPIEVMKKLNQLNLS